MNKDYEIEKIEAYLFGETSASEAVEIKERIALDADFAAQVRMIEALINGIRQHSFNEAKKSISSVKRNEYLEKTLDEIEQKIKIEKLKNLETRLVASGEEIGLHSKYISSQQENISLQESEKQTHKMQKRRNNTMLLFLITFGFIIVGFTFLLIPLESPSIATESVIENNYIEKDSDNDGYNDNVDECPNERGECKGCLCSSKVNDSDKDNIPDKEDKCPDEYGVEALNGCPEKEKPTNKSEEIAKTGDDRKVYWEENNVKAYRMPEEYVFLKLSYGTYVGNVINGKPNGEGKLIYNSSHLISSMDVKKRHANEGDYLVGKFKNGHFVEGKWYDKNNNLIEIITIGK
jgi:hypothetical protein